jgi:hypothetical protein
MRIADLIVRVQGEFLNGRTALTAQEVRRRVATDSVTCDALLDALVDAGVLERLGNLYTRADHRCPAVPPTASPQLAA